jgi:cytoskeletal protein CcmA (bactofilin family)
MFSKGKAESERKRKVSAPTIISEGLTVTGNLDSDGEVQVDGLVQGDIKSLRLSIGQNGRIVGAVQAERVLIRGRIDGQIRAQEVTLTRTAQVKGDIHHETLTIEPGATIDGHCRRLNAVDDDGATTNLNLVISDGKASIS